MYLFLAVAIGIGLLVLIVPGCFGGGNGLSD